MTLGVVRKMDERGRIQIPPEFISRLGFAVGEELNVVVEEGRVVIAPYYRKCHVCGMKAAEDSNLCKRCIARFVEEEEHGGL